MVRGLRRRRGSDPSSEQEAGELSIDVEVEVVRRKRKRRIRESVATWRTNQGGGRERSVALAGKGVTQSRRRDADIKSRARLSRTTFG